MLLLVFSLKESNCWRVFSFRLTLLVGFIDENTHHRAKEKRTHQPSNWVADLRKVIEIDVDCKLRPG